MRRSKSFRDKSIAKIHNPPVLTKFFNNENDENIKVFQNKKSTNSI